MIYLNYFLSKFNINLSLKISDSLHYQFLFEMYVADHLGSPDIGVFSLLTNKYAFLCPSPTVEYFSLMDSVLTPHNIPVFRFSVANSNIVGRLCVGNSKGLLLPNTVKDHELLSIRNSLPDEIIVQRVDDRLSALGNIISTNDSITLINPDCDRETEEVIQDVFQTEVIRHSIAGLPLVGTYCKMTNKGCLVSPLCSLQEQEELASLIGLPVCAGTVNQGNQQIGAGLIVNDFVGFIGRDSTSTEISVCKRIFGLETDKANSDMLTRMLGEGVL